MNTLLIEQKIAEYLASEIEWLDDAEEIAVRSKTTPYPEMAKDILCMLLRQPSLFRVVDADDDG